MQQDKSIKSDKNWRLKRVAKSRIKRAKNDVDADKNKITRYFSSKTNKNLKEADKIKAEVVYRETGQVTEHESLSDGWKVSLKVETEGKRSDSDCAGLHSLVPTYSKEGVSVMPEERLCALAKSPHCDTNHHNPSNSRDTTVTGRNGSNSDGRLSPHLSFNFFH